MSSITGVKATNGTLTPKVCLSVLLLTLPPAASRSRSLRQALSSLRLSCTALYCLILRVNKTLSARAVRPSVSLMTRTGIKRRHASVSHCSVAEQHPLSRQLLTGVEFLWFGGNDDDSCREHSWTASSGRRSAGSRQERASWITGGRVPTRSGARRFPAPLPTRGQFLKFQPSS